MKNNACKRVSTDQQAVELLSSWQRAHKITLIDQDMCQESIKKLPRNLDGSRIYRECVEQTESIEKILDGSSCYQGSVEVTKKSLDRKDFY